MCKAIDDPTLGNDTFAKLYGAANIYYNYTGNATCFDLDDHSDPHGLGEWRWQVPTCIELFLNYFYYILNLNKYCDIHHVIYVLIHHTNSIIIILDIKHEP